MWNLRYHQARTAMTDGRLDEAYDLVRRHGLNESRDGQRLVDRLVECYVLRAATHLDVGRLGAASSDHARAEQLGGRREDVASLGQRIEAARHARRREERLRSAAVDRARNAFGLADYDAGFRVLAGVDRSPSVVALAEEMHMLRGQGERLVQQVTDAIDRGEIDEALRLVGRPPLPAEGTLEPTLRRLVGEALDRLDRDFRDGRLRAASATIDGLARIRPDDLRVCEWQDRLAGCRAAWQACADHDYRKAVLALRRVMDAAPDATWIAEAVGRLGRLAEESDAVATGPLAQFDRELPSPIVRSPRTEPTRIAADLRRTVAHGPMTRKARPGSAGSLLLRIEGVGSYLLITEPTVTVGPISSTDRPMVGLIADPVLPVVTIERNDEDHLLHARQPVTVNGQWVDRHVLRDGDRIGLSPTTRVKFTRPNAASQTAVLRFGGSRLPQGDVRDVVLLGRELIVGASAAAHLRTGTSAEPVKFVRRGDGLVCTTGAVAADRQALPADHPLPFDQPIEIGPLVVTLSRS